MITTALLVLWSRGWAQVVDAGAVATYGRREAMLGLGSVESVAELTRIGSEQLRLYGRPMVEISADLQPMMPVADRPYRAFMVGDVVSTVPGPSGATSERVVELTVQEDENGEVTYAPTFRDLIVEQQDAFQEQLKKMANGTLGGSPAATPMSGVSVTSVPDCCPPAATEVTES